MIRYKFGSCQQDVNIFVADYRHAVSQMSGNANPTNREVCTSLYMLVWTALHESRSSDDVSWGMAVATELATDKDSIVRLGALSFFESLLLSFPDVLAVTKRALSDVDPAVRSDANMYVKTMIEQETDPTALREIGRHLLALPNDF